MSRGVPSQTFGYSTDLVPEGFTSISIDPIGDLNAFQNWV